MKIGILFCGGCNPRYDRTDIAERLREEFGRDAVVRAGEEPVDVLAVICGCHVACVAHEAFDGTSGKVILTRESDYETLRTLIVQTSTAIKESPE